MAACAHILGPSSVSQVAENSFYSVFANLRADLPKELWVMSKISSTPMRVLAHSWDHAHLLVVLRAIHMMAMAPIVACATDVRNELLRIQDIPQRALSM